MSRRPPERPASDVASASPIPRAALEGIIAAIALATLVGIGLSLSIPLLSLEMERMGASGGQIGLNTAIAGFASIITLPFAPRLAARLGVGRLIFLAILVTALSFPLSSCSSPMRLGSRSDLPFRSRSVRCSCSQSSGWLRPPRQSGAAW